MNGRRFLTASLIRLPKTFMLSILKQVRLNESFPTATEPTLVCTCSNNCFYLFMSEKKNQEFFFSQKLKQMLYYV